MFARGRQMYVCLHSSTVETSCSSPIGRSNEPMNLKRELNRAITHYETVIAVLPTTSKI